MFYDYCESGSLDRADLPRQHDDFRRSACASASPSTWPTAACAATMLGQDVAMPVALAPVGLTGMQHADGEIKAARAAERFGVPFTPVDHVDLLDRGRGRPTTKPFWFQLYVMRDEEFVDSVIERAKAAELLGAGADARPADPGPAAQGPQERPFGAAQADAAGNGWTSRPSGRWGLEMLRTKRRGFGNIVGHAEGVGDTASLMSLDGRAVRPAPRLGQGRARSRRCGAAS